MPGDRSKIDYAKGYFRRTYTVSPALTSGLLVAGKNYQILRFIAGDDFSNVGAPANAAGTVFIATGTTPATWSNGSRVAEILLDDLRQLAADTFASASDEVTINTVSYEGGSAGGQVKFEKVLVGIALEELLAELDPDYLEPVLTPMMGRPWGATVRLGC
ncbi:hypothetical protein BH20VER3_BH20VER3_00580 [soil metagenome]